MNLFSDSTEYLTLLPILTTPISCEAVKAHSVRGLKDNAFAASIGFRSVWGDWLECLASIFRLLPRERLERGFDFFKVESNYAP